MELVLESWPSRIIAAALAVAATASLSLNLWQHIEAGRLADEGGVLSLQQAERLEPANAELYWREGRQELYSESGNPAAAITALEKAAQLDPRTGIYWTDLAQARESNGDLAGAVADFGKARTAEPRTPAILWQSMSFALRNKEPQQALDFGRELLAAAPPYTGRVLPQLVEIADLSTLIRDVIPADQVALDVVAAYICNQGALDAVPALWERVMAAGLPPSPFYLRYLLESMIAQGQGELAAAVWRDSATRHWIDVEPSEAEVAFYNGDFRRPMLGFGFDWRALPQEEASVWVSDEGPQAGQPCLCVDFSDRARADFNQVAHPLVVVPGHDYLLTAKMRVRHIATRAGAFLTVVGLGAPGQAAARTDSVIGSTGWEDVSARFSAGPQTRAAQVAFVRPGVGPEEPPASGQMCIAEVGWKQLNTSIEPETAAAMRRRTR